jgi:hypothetical protein
MTDQQSRLGQETIGFSHYFGGKPQKPSREAGMTRNRESLTRSPVSIHTAADRHQATDAQWEQIVVELRECRDKPEDLLDEFAIARYLSGEGCPTEREQIQQAIGQSPVLAECILLAQQSLGDAESAA